MASKNNDQSVGSRGREKQPVAEQTPLVIYEHMQRMPNIVHIVYQFFYCPLLCQSVQLQADHRASLPDWFCIDFVDIHF